jgi:hypothetical protein
VSFQGLDAPSDAVGELGTLSLFTNVEREARAWRQASE